jgi:hypothetical protein
MARNQDLWRTIDATIDARDPEDAERPAAPRILLYGIPGTGKTYVASTYGVNGHGLESVTLNQGTPMAELRGHYLPRGAEWQWHDGQCIRAWRKGSRLVLNEIDRAADEALTFLYNVLDDPRFAMLTLPNGETVKPAPTFQCIATMNGQPEDLPPALQERFPVAFHVDALAPGAVNALPDHLQAIAKQTAVKPVGDPGRISLRQWQSFAILDRVLGREQAAFSVFGPRGRDIVTGLAIGEAPDPDARTNHDREDETIPEPPAHTVGEAASAPVVIPVATGKDDDPMIPASVATATVLPSCPRSAGGCGRRDRVRLAPDGKCYCSRCGITFAYRKPRNRAGAR